MKLEEGKLPKVELLNYRVQHTAIQAKLSLCKNTNKKYMKSNNTVIIFKFQTRLIEFQTRLKVQPTAGTLTGTGTGTGRFMMVDYR